MTHDIVSFPTLDDAEEIIHFCILIILMIIDKVADGSAFCFKV